MDKQLQTKSMSLISLLTLCLFAVGIAFGAIVLYQQLEVSTANTQVLAPQAYAVSKLEAEKIAMDQANNELYRDSAELANETVHAKLVYVTGNGVGFTIDNGLGYYSGKFNQTYDNKYLWRVDITTFDNGGSADYWYITDANTGRVIGNDRSL